jgi:response regulator RpfG family c-di-GMP phosphodiesterase
LLDVRMPRMSGEEVFARLHEAHSITCKSPSSARIFYSWSSVRSHMPSWNARWKR